jgi:FMN phosphatase YigB (HAD superfamily)
MKKLFIFDFDDTLANYSMYNTFVLKQPLKILPHFGGTIPGAVEVLDFLKEKRDRLAMLSMNIVLDDQLKWKKLNRLGMERWFSKENAHFVRHKTPKKIIEICGRTRLDRCYMIGNSLEHDVRPALEAGINAIYIPRPLATSWLPRKLPREDRFLKLSSIVKIIDLYDDL